MVTVHITSDWKFVRSCVEALQDRVLDDEARKDPGSYLDAARELVLQDENCVFEVRNEVGERVGCFLFVWVEDHTWEVHTLLLPECRGLNAIIAGRAVCKWMFDIAGAEKLVSFCPENMPEVLLFARRCGFKKTGFHKNQWVVGGVPYRQVMVERLKESI